MAHMAAIMNRMIAATLIAANQNSASPNIFTLNMLRVNTTPRAMSANTHCGMARKGVQ